MINSKGLSCIGINNFQGRLVGNPNASLLIIGEAPGEHEDLSGEPFVGRAGKLLDKMLLAINMSRKNDVFICNVLKCRPPDNRNPKKEEIDECEPYLINQIDLIFSHSLTNLI